MHTRWWATEGDAVSGLVDIAATLGFDPSAMLAPRIDVPPRAPGQSFANLLEEGFRARASRLGLTLPTTSTALPTSSVDDAAADPTGGEDPWKLAQLRSAAAGNSPGDAMLKALDDAAAARYDRAHRPQGMFDFLVG